MRGATRSLGAFWLSMMLLLGPWGCALAPQLPPPPPSEQLRATLGTIAIVSAPLTLEAALEGPTSGKWSGAAKGAATGFFGWIVGGAQAAGGDPLLGAFIIATAPVAGIVGAVVGAVKAEPQAGVKEAEAALKDALVSLKSQEGIRDRVFQVARTQTRHPVVLRTEQGPADRGDQVSHLALASEGIDTVLEVSVPTIGLVGGGINPPLPLVVGARARLIRTLDGTALYDQRFEYRSGTRTFTEWGVNNAQPFREEVDRAYQGLAEKIVEELFLVYLPPRAAPK